MPDQIHIFDLDTLLDTRLPILAKLNPELAVKIVNDPEARQKYLSRPNDLFAEFGIDAAEFEAAYAKRNVETLMQALPTNFLFELATIGNALVTLKSQEPHQVDEIRFVVNMYPYSDLTEVERERILDAVGSRIQAIIHLDHTYEPPKRLSPAAIKASHYSAVYFYDFRGWLKEHYHVDRVNEHTIDFMPGVYIHSAPHFIDLDQLKEAVEFQNPKGENTDPITGLQVMFSPYFRLELIRMELFSLVDVNTVVKDIS